MNSRIKDVAGLAGAKAEAVAQIINIDYKPDDPGSTTILLSYRDYITDSEGNALPYTGDAWTPISLSLQELTDMLEGQVDIMAMVEDLKLVADVVHNARFGEQE